MASLWPLTGVVVNDNSAWNLQYSFSFTNGVDGQTVNCSGSSVINGLPEGVNYTVGTKLEC